MKKNKFKNKKNLYKNKLMNRFKKKILIYKL